MLFTVKKGNHYSDQFLYKSFNFLNINGHLEFKVNFNDSCRYSLPKEDQEDINKLFGFSIGFNHHKDSARFGWFYKEGEIHLYSYTYIEGKRSYEFISKLEIGKEYLLSIFYIGDQWEFWACSNKNLLGVKTVKSKRSFSTGYKLWPYFGGNNPATHDITISMVRSLIY